MTTSEDGNDESRDTAKDERRQREHREEKTSQQTALHQQKGANNNMFCANYPRDIQGRGAGLLCCTARPKWVYVPGRHILIPPVLVSRSQSQRKQLLEER
ncbi:unnamed protein product [Pleuronectes platessa]|uniref:Uncharacterized protein n=1 Tax=Pleuronectes platessa TaxID=8262 RepID=A0A9N7VLY4_PLEPL|nr:unnamed protein product [Pleuronectes platessa]